MRISECVLEIHEILIVVFAAQIFLDRKYNSLHSLSHSHCRVRVLVNRVQLPLQCVHMLVLALRNVLYLGE